MSEEVDAREILKEISGYDLNIIPRRAALGEAFSFEAAVEPARKIQSFFSRIPADYISELSNSFQNEIKNQGLAFLNILEQIQSFDPSSDNAPASRNSIIQTLEYFYESLFGALHHTVSFIAARQRDFSNLELEARSAAESAKREAKKLSEELQAKQKEAAGILDEIRKTAAEQGVSQQAHHFHTEAENHGTEVANWHKFTVRTAIGLGVYALISLIFSIFYTPANQYQAIQIGISKVLIFGVIAYMLFYCSKILMANRHNQVVNKHRENALLTFNALVSAGSADDKRDIVLTHAAACIFSPQDSGYSKSGQGAGSSSPLIEILPRITQQS